MVIDKLKNWYLVNKLDKKDSLTLYNPWEEGGVGYEKIEEFIEALGDSGNSFKWIEHEKAATKYSIPQQVQGDFEDANLYCCLYNPGVSENIWESNAYNLKVFIEENSATPYIQRMFDFDGKDYESLKVTDVYNKIINPENILHQEMKIIKKRLEEKMEGEWENAVDKYLVDIINGKKKSTSLEDGDSCYYIKSYYAALIAGGVSKDYKKVAIENISKQVKDREMDCFENASICNLELIPFASQKKEDIKSNTKDMDKFKEFVVAIILSRIAKYYCEGETEEPVFIFRSKSEWFKAIESFIKDKKNNIDPQFEGIYQSELINFFFEFSSQNAMISQSNIRALINESDYQTKFLKGSGIRSEM